MRHQLGDAGEGLAALAIGGTEGPTEDPTHPTQPFLLWRDATPVALLETRARRNFGQRPKTSGTLSGTSKGTIGAASILTYDFSRSASRPAEFPLRTKSGLRSARAKRDYRAGRGHCAQQSSGLLGGTSKWGESSEC